MADILKFPNKRQQTVNEKVGILRNRLEELATEADLIADDISYLQDMQVKGIAEGEEIIKEISELIGVAIPTEEDIVYPKDTTTDKWDELANTTLDASLKLLEDAVKQLKFDFNKDKPDDNPKDK